MKKQGPAPPVHKRGIMGGLTLGTLFRKLGRVQTSLPAHQRALHSYLYAQVSDPFYDGDFVLRWVAAERD